MLPVKQLPHILEENQLLRISTVEQLQTQTPRASLTSLLEACFEIGHLFPRTDLVHGTKVIWLQLIFPDALPDALALARGHASLG